MAFVPGAGEPSAARPRGRRDASPFACAWRGARRWGAARHPGKRPRAFELGFSPRERRGRVTQGRAAGDRWR